MTSKAVLNINFTTLTTDVLFTLDHFVFLSLFLTQASVLLVLPGCGGCAFRDASLQTLAESSGYTSSCCLDGLQPVWPLWPLTSWHQARHFPPDNCRWLTGYFLFFGAFAVNPRDGCVSVKNPTLAAICETLGRAAWLAPTTNCNIIQSGGWVGVLQLTPSG